VSQRIVLAGGSGFLGQALAANLVADGMEVVVLTRSPRASAPCGRELPWDGETLGPWAEALDGAAAVINLTGKSVDCRYTPENCTEIITSRVNSVRVIGEAISACKAPPPAWVQAGTLAIYGDAGERICDEDAPHGEGFSVVVSEVWEREFDRQEVPRTRRTQLRIGFALGRSGGRAGKTGAASALWAWRDHRQRPPIHKLAARLGLDPDVSLGNRAGRRLGRLQCDGADSGDQCGVYALASPRRRPAVESPDSIACGSHRRLPDGQRRIDRPDRTALRAPAFSRSGIRVRPHRSRTNIEPLAKPNLARRHNILGRSDESGDSKARGAF